MTARLPLVIPFLSGLLFAVGLAIGGMTQPGKVVGFLDVTGNWDLSLMFVMGGAVAVHFIAYRLVKRMRSPLTAPRFAIPTRRDIDARLIGGAVLFGLGWGLGGFCPGPAIVSAVTTATVPLVFIASMIAGMVAFHVVNHALAGARSRGTRAAVPTEVLP